MIPRILNIILGISNINLSNIKGGIVAQECELLEECGFFKKYKDTKELVCQGYIQKYCKSEKQDECKRKEYRKQHGTAPPDDMMPSGHMVSS